MEEPTEIVNCIIIDNYGRILLLHRQQDETGYWELPGGRVDDEEMPETAAIRTATYELNTGVTLTKSLGHETYERDEAPYKMYWFQAVIDKQDPDVRALQEFDDYEYIEIEDLPSLSLSDEMLLFQEKILSGEIVLNA